MNFDKISIPSAREEFVRAIGNKLLSGKLPLASMEGVISGPASLL